MAAGCNMKRVICRLHVRTRTPVAVNSLNLFEKTTFFNVNQLNSSSNLVVFTDPDNS
jgi:hypothetical protein